MQELLVEKVQGEHSGVTASGDSGARVISMRNVVAASLPSQTAVPTASQPLGVVFALSRLMLFCILVKEYDG